MVLIADVSITVVPPRLAAFWRASRASNLPVGSGGQMVWTGTPDRRLLRHSASTGPLACEWSMAVEVVPQWSRPRTASLVSRQQGQDCCRLHHSQRDVDGSPDERPRRGLDLPKAVLR